MSDFWDEGGERVRRPAGASRAAHTDRASPKVFEVPGRPGVGRGIVLTAVALVLGVLLLPSATRAPLAVEANSTRATTPATPAPSAAPAPSPGRSSTTSTATPPPPSSVHVLVANATSTNGVAGAVTQFLGGKGFATLAAVNALVKLNTSQVYFTSAGSAGAGTEVASALSLPASVVQTAGSAPPVSSATGASVVVIAGQDLAGRFAPGSSTATTARG